jgi:hypothetical protein
MDKTQNESNLVPFSVCPSASQGDAQQASVVAAFRSENPVGSLYAAFESDFKDWKNNFRRPSCNCRNNMIGNGGGWHHSAKVEELQGQLTGKDPVRDDTALSNAGKGAVKHLPMK